MPSPRPPQTLLLAVLGGIASGKSEVARLLAGPQGLVLDADRMAHAELGSPHGLQRLRERFGPQALGADGTPDRAFLAQRVFGSEIERRWLEGWIHPAVRVRMQAELSQARARGVPRVVLDVPLLLENDGLHGLASACDALVFVDASKELREERVLRTRGWSRGELERREAAQLPLETKRARADHVIENEADLDALAAQVTRVLAHHEPA